MSKVFYRVLHFFALFIFVVSSVPAFPASPSGITLTNDIWAIAIRPTTLEVLAQPKAGAPILLSASQADLGTVSGLEQDQDRLSWELPEQGIAVSLQLKASDFMVQIRSKNVGAFTWPILSLRETAKALIWPHWEGQYIPLDDERWVNHLVDYGAWDTLEGLTMPFWGLDCGDYSLTYIVTNRYNNEIRFSKEEEQLLARFTHDFPPNHARREYGFLIRLGDNRTPVEPALKFRQWLIDQGKFVSMKEKMKKTPEVERLLGAPHIYLWGDAYLSRNDVRSPENRWTKIWKPFCRQMIRESESEKPAVGKRIKQLMKPEGWNQVLEMTQVPYDYVYLQRDLAYGLSRLLALPDFYDELSWQDVVIPDEAKELLAQERASLSPRELCRVNGLLLRAAYPGYLSPVDDWGGGLSVKMLKQLKEAGFDRLRICLDGWEGVEKRPEVAARADEMGYLFGIYDSFHSIHPPAWQGTDSTWPTAQFNQELYDTGGITRRDGNKRKGFKQQGYMLSPIAARPYVEERVNRNFKNVPYNYYFVDCDAYGQVFDDYTPGRIVPQRQDAMARNDRLAWIRDTHGAVIGSEGGSSYAAPVIHVAEGMFIPAFGWGDPDLKDKESEYYQGGYYPPEGPAIFFKASQLKEEYRYSHLDPRFRLPLYEVVFHDSVVSTSHWSKGNLKYPEEQDLIFLTQLLYQVPPMYHVNADEFNKRKDTMKTQYDFFSLLHRELGFSPMTDFAWLTADRLVQRTTFEDRVEIIANFSEQIFTYQAQAVPPGSVLVYWRDSAEVWVYPRQG